MNVLSRPKRARRGRVERISAIETRWYAPLLQPVLPTVSRALDRLGAERDPWSLPRAGLGGAMVLQVARGFGSRAHARSEQFAIAAVEGYNHRLHLGQPSSEERSRWLARDLRWASRAWRIMAERDQATLDRVVDRLLGPGDEIVDRPIPEAVLFLRAAVAGGVVLGEVAESSHAVLDEYVTWLGLAWEARAGTLDRCGWAGALVALREREVAPVDLETAEALARERARAALTKLPPDEVVRLFEAALTPPTEPDARSPEVRRGWMPMTTPTPRPRTPRGAMTSRTTLDALSEQWRESIELAIAESSASGSTTLTHATDYLRGQGGKRVRPILTLACARACAGDPRRALPLAAAIEWLHQGSLVLDDIIDVATIRRGHPALHSATSETFAAGVAFFVLGRVLRASKGMHPDIRRHVLDTALALVEGERLELLATGAAELDLTRYYAIIEAKTARLFACAAAVGGLCADAPAARVAALHRFGREIGLAFQIIDDLLDYEADGDLFGKQPGTDLRAAKPTLPFLFLRDALPADERPRLASALGSSDEFEWVKARLIDHGIGERARARAELHTTRALEALDELPEGAARLDLERLARELGSRAW